MKSLGFKQSNLLIDIRLAVGFTACAICATTFYYDYTLGFEKTKHLTIYAVVAYFTLNTFLTWWMWWVEGGKVFVGQRDGVKVCGRPCPARRGRCVLTRDGIENSWSWRATARNTRRYTN